MTSEEGGSRIASNTFALNMRTIVDADSVVALVTWGIILRVTLIAYLSLTCQGKRDTCIELTQCVINVYLPY